MDKFLVRMKDPSILEPEIQNTIEPQPQAYTMEALATNRPQRFLLDRVHQEREKKRHRIDESMRHIRNEANEAEKADEITFQAPPEPLVRNADGSVDPPSTREFREKVMYVEDVESGVIPHTTNELCKWDMQPFTGVPFPIPVKYERREKKLLVIGFTCSVRCALAYLKHDGFEVCSYEQRQLTIQLAKDYYGASYSEDLLLPAPPREKLSMLYAKHACKGVENPMLSAIRDFRDESEQIIYHPHPAPPFIRVTQRIDEEVIRKERAEQHRQRLDLMNATPQPLACTPRGMQEQRKYVLARQTGNVKQSRGVINTLLNIHYKPVSGEDNDSSSDE